MAAMNKVYERFGAAWVPTPKRARLSRDLAAALAFAVFLALSLVGCASSSPETSSSQPKPGSGIAEYREVVHEAHESVSAVVKSLEKLTESYTSSSASHPPLARFDKAFHQLELTSMRTRSRADAIIARGEAYFEEWKEQLTGSTNASQAQAETQRFARWRGHFDRVRSRSADVRTEFRPFMANLRTVRARLDQPSIGSAGELPRDLNNLTNQGKRVLQSLRAVEAALDEAEAEVRGAPSAAAGGTRKVASL